MLLKTHPTLVNNENLYSFVTYTIGRDLFVNCIALRSLVM